MPLSSFKKVIHHTFDLTAEADLNLTGHSMTGGVMSGGYQKR